MSYLIKKSDGSFLIEINDNVIDTKTLSLALFGKNTTNYGSYVDQNNVFLLERFSNDNAPATPIVGQCWYDRNNKILKVFNNVSWDYVLTPVDPLTNQIRVSVEYWGTPVTILVTIAQSQVLSAESYYQIDNIFLPETIQYMGNSFAFKTLFPNGLSVGVTLATLANVTLEYHGNSYGTNSLRIPRIIGLTGDFSGNVMFDGTSNVNINASFSNLYVGNSNVSIGGMYTNVTVDATGRITNLGNITYSDVVSALGYVPYSDANAAVSATPNTLVIRDSNGSFSANLVTATTAYTQKFVNNVTIQLEGEVEGSSAQFNGSSNVIINSSRSMNSNVAEGVYNSITVNNKGEVEAGQLIENLPIGSIILYNNSVVIPEGWAVCNGGNVVSPNGQTITTPNLVNVAVGGTTYIMKVFRNVYLPSNDTIVGTLSVNLTGGSVPVVTLVGGPDIKYPPLVFSNVNVAATGATASTYTTIKKVKIPNEYKNPENTSSKLFNGKNYKLNDVLYFDFPNFDRKSAVKVTEITSNGGISKLELLEEGKYKPYIPNGLGSKPSSIKSVKATGGSGQDAEFDLEIERVNQPLPVQDVDFKDNLFFDAVSVILSGGDPNAVMFSQANIYGDLSNLTVLQILDNLTVRRLTGLPPRLGKYMLSLDDIINYSGVLQIPVNITSFTVALQNRLMLLKITDFSNEFSYLGYYPSDDKLFGAAYIGFAQYVAVLKANRTDRVKSALLAAGLASTGIDTIDNITVDQLLTYCSKMIVNAKVAVFNNKTARNIALEINSTLKNNLVPVPPPLVLTPLLTTGNANIILSESVIDGIAVMYGGNKPSSNANIAFGGGSFIKGGSVLNNNIYDTINGVRYGYYGDPGGGGGGGGGDSATTSTSRTDLSTGTGTRVPPGGMSVIPGAQAGGTTVSSTIAPGSGYYSALFGQESGGNYNVFYTGKVYGDLGQKTIAQVFELQDINKSATGGTAVGVGQFLKRTLQDLLNTPEAIARGITTNTNFTPEVQNELLEIFTQRNANTLSAKGIPITDANVAGAHLLGAGGFNTLYQNALANPNLPTSELFSQDVINGNPGILRGKTLGQVLEYFKNKYGVGQSWRAGVVPATSIYAPGSVNTTILPLPPSVVTTTTLPPPPPTAADLAKGLTAVASRIVNAVSPPSAVVQVVAAVVPESVQQVVNVTTVVVQNAVTIAQTAGQSVLNNAVSLLNKVLEDNGTQPPAVKSSTGVGGTVVNAVRPSLPTVSSGGTGGGTSSGGFSLGGTAGVSTGRTVTSSAPPGGTISSGTQLSFSSSVTGGKTATSGVMSSGASLSFGSSVSSATSASGSTATYSLGTTAPKPTSGGTGSSPVNTGGAFGLKGCFVYDTLIDMLDGTVKKIGELRLGDQIRGGEVLAIHCYDGAPLYNYRGVHVSGTHYVFENDSPIMVKDSVHAVKIDDVYGLYTVDTSGRRIFVNDIEFADHNGDGVIFEFFENSKTTTFNNQKEIFDEVLRQVKDAKL